jgi:hypothetical protein
MIEGMNLTKAHCKHIWKYDNENPHVQLIHANKMFKTNPLCHLLTWQEIHKQMYKELKKIKDQRNK